MKNTPVIALFASVLSGCSEPRSDAAADSTLQAFLPQWEAAQTAFINGDPTLWKQNASQYTNSGASMKAEYITTGVGGDLGFTVAIERQEGARVGGQQRAQRALRVTQIFRKEDGKWKLLHRHADPLVEKTPPLPMPSK